MALGQGLNTAIEDPGQDRVWGLGKAPKGVLFFVLVKGETDRVGVIPSECPRIAGAGCQ